MKSRFIAVVLLLGASAVWAAPPKLTGSWEAAHSSADDDRVSLVLREMGKAEIISEYDISVPGQGKRRGRSTSFGKWTLKGNDLRVTYAKITDRLRYSDHVSLSAVGEQGDAPALTPIGKPPANSKIGNAVLWKAPHDHRSKAAPPAANAGAPKAAEPAAVPAK
jgi:hypothetical protein